MKLLIGTHNPAKQQDFVRSLTRAFETVELTEDIEFVFPQDLEIKDDINESGSTFEENSEIKARFYFAQSNLPTISDDGGIMIHVLNNLPGVKTRRWAGDDSTDEELIAYVIKQLEPYQKSEDRATTFRTCTTFFNGTNFVQASGEIVGHIAQTPLPIKTFGFPMRSIFVLPNGKYYDELTSEEHDMYNHRDKAVQKLVGSLMGKSILV